MMEISDSYPDFRGYKTCLYGIILIIATRVWCHGAGSDFKARQRERYCLSKDNNDARFKIRSDIQKHAVYSFVVLSGVCINIIKCLDACIRSIGCP